MPHDEIVSMILENPAETVAQVVFGKYVESSGLVFSGELIQQMIDRRMERVLTDRWQDEEVVQEAVGIGRYLRDTRSLDDPRINRFATGIDFARKTDFTVIKTLDCRFRPARLVYYRRLNRVPWESIYREVGRALSIFGPRAIGDSTGMGGDVVFDALESRFYCPHHDQTRLIGSGSCTDGRGAPLGGCKTEDYISCGSVEPFDFGPASKQQLIEHLRNVLSVGYRAGSAQPFGWLRIPPIVQTEEEMSFYIWDDRGLETDNLMSLALAAWLGLEDAPGPVSVGSLHGA